MAEPIEYVVSEDSLTEALRKASHSLKLCKDAGTFHRFAHPEDEDDANEAKIFVAHVIMHHEEDRRTGSGQGHE